MYPENCVVYHTIVSGCSDSLTRTCPSGPDSLTRPGRPSGQQEAMELFHERLDATIEIVTDTARQVIESEPLPRLRPEMTICRKSHRSISPEAKSIFIFQISRQRIDFEVYVSGFYYFEYTDVYLNFDTPVNASITRDTISLNEVTWNCNLVHQITTDRTVLQRRIQNNDGVIDRAGLTEYFTNIHVLYQHLKSKYIALRTEAYHHARIRRFLMMCMCHHPRLGENSPFRLLPREILPQIAEQLVYSDMRLQGLLQ